MHACVLRATGPVEEQPLSHEEVERPTPARGEALIRVRVCGVCRTDLHVVEGELDQSRQRSPLIPGHQIVGEIVSFGDDTDPGDFSIGDRVGIAWLGGTCGACTYCGREQENLCDDATFTGWTRDGGYAEYCTARVDWLYPLPGEMRDLDIAPLLCAGIIGWRCLKFCADSLEPREWRGRRIGIYGFGAAGHLAIQIALHRGAEVHVLTRDERHQRLAEELGAASVGGGYDAPPVKLDAAIIFAPAGEIVPVALKALDKAGRLILGGIHMSPIPEIDYRDLYWERIIRSVANNTRDDGVAFLKEAAEAGVSTRTERFALADANEALLKLKTDAIRGAAVLEVAE